MGSGEDWGATALGSKGLWSLMEELEGCEGSGRMLASHSVGDRLPGLEPDVVTGPVTFLMVGECPTLAAAKWGSCFLPPPHLSSLPLDAGKPL